MPSFSRPLADCPDAALRPVAGVLTDIDDTLTHEGAIEPEALRALADLRAAGLPVIAITGRPMGWSEPFARDWPIDAIVAENGAVALFMEGGHLRTEYAQDEATRAHNAQRLAAAAQRVLREVPGATLARDSAGRVTDIAVDHSEFAHLSAGRIDAVVAIMREQGMNATVSSITSTAGSARTTNAAAHAGSFSACWAARSRPNAGAGSTWATRPTTS